MGSDCNKVAVHCVQDLEGTLARYLPALYRVAFRQLRNHEDAEDAVQDALLPPSHIFHNSRAVRISRHGSTESLLTRRACIYGDAKTVRSCH